MTETDETKIVSLKEKPLENVSLRDLAKEGGSWKLGSSLNITPGYDPADLYTGRKSPSYPIDRYGTAVNLGEGNVFSVDIRKSGKKLEALTSRLNTLTRLFKPSIKNTSETEIYVIEAEVSKVSKAANVYCSPNAITEKLRVKIDSKSPFTLEDTVVIFPDYSNISENVVTTADMFGIVISPGANVLLETGGQIGNVKIIIKEGHIRIPCNPDISVTSVEAVNV